MDHWRKPSASILLMVGLCLGLLVALPVAELLGIDVPLLDHGPEWSIGVYEGDTPFDIGPSGLPQPALTRSNIDDVHAEFVADPFMIERGSVWYMFFEVMNDQTGLGEIGLATSDDGAQWTYRQIVLREPFHLSYPDVFKWDGEYYMVPESARALSVRLYHATSFPDEWEYVGPLLSGEHFVDPSLLHYEGQWWLFVGIRSDQLRLYCSDALEGSYSSHPKSPLVRADSTRARPAGRIIEFDGRIIRFAQNDQPWYGSQVRAFEVITLSSSDYQERLVRDPFLEGNGVGWNALGMHHVDLHETADGKWIACVDGHRNSLSFSQGYWRLVGLLSRFGWASASTRE